MRSRRALASGLPVTHRKVNELLPLSSGFGVPTPTPTLKPPFVLKLATIMLVLPARVLRPVLRSHFSAMPVRGCCIPCPCHPVCPVPLPPCPHGTPATPSPWCPCHPVCTVQQGGQTLEMENIHLFVCAL